MRDTQWPRYEVFIQDRADRPHRSVGSVHAVDSEMALLNARTVFVRRPACHNMWVVPAEAISAVTLQELEEGVQLADASPQGKTEPYLVFQKRNQRRGMTYVTHVGQVDAATPRQALSRAQEKFSQRPVYVWWLCPAAAVTSSDPSDIDSLFRPAEEKSYRHQKNYANVGLP